jgi:hypothetical protein
MTRLALGAKWGGLTAMRSAATAPPADARSTREPSAPVNIEASAIFPTPTPHSLKKCRRVIRNSLSS